MHINPNPPPEFIVINFWMHILHTFYCLWKSDIPFFWSSLTHRRKCVSHSYLLPMNGWGSTLFWTLRMWTGWKRFHHILSACCVKANHLLKLHQYWSLHVRLHICHNFDNATQSSFRFDCLFYNFNRMRSVYILQYTLHISNLIGQLRGGHTYTYKVDTIQIKRWW